MKNDLLEFQKPLVAGLHDHLTNGKTILGLFAAPNAGKTIMSIRFIEDFVAARIEPANYTPIIVYAHSQGNLRDQYYDRCQEQSPAFSYVKAESAVQLREAFAWGTQVIITLPATVRAFGYDNLPSIGLFVIDEAQQNVETRDERRALGMIKKSMRKHVGTVQLFLSGTPGRLVGRYKKNPNFGMVTCPMTDVPDEQMVETLHAELCGTQFHVRDEDYSADGELPEGTLDDDTKLADGREKVMQLLLERAQSRLRDPGWYWSLPGAVVRKVRVDRLFTDLGPTLWVCSGVKDAEKTYAAFKHLGGVYLSTSKNDPKNAEFTKFINDDRAKILIVVFKGILGFDLKKLVNIVDFSFTRNVVKIHQKLMRLARRHEAGAAKLFIKVVPGAVINCRIVDGPTYFRAVMSVVWSLCKMPHFTDFNPDSYSDDKVVRTRIVKGDGEGGDGEGGDGEGGGDGENKPTKTKPVFDIISYCEGENIRDILKDLRHKDSEPLSGICYISMREARTALLGTRDMKPLTDFDREWLKKLAAPGVDMTLVKKYLQACGIAGSEEERLLKEAGIG